MDLAPLIDIVFQLLIFFMLTSTFSNPSIKMLLPRASTQETAEREQIVISITQSGEIFLNDERKSLESLRPDLERVLQKNPEKSVYIRGDQEMPYKYFVEMVDLAKQAGAQQVNIVHKKTEP